MVNSDFSLFEEIQINPRNPRTKIGWSAVWTGIWPRFKVLIVFDMIFIEWYCISKVSTHSSIGDKMADMSGSRTSDECFPAWCLVQGTQ